jgi:hypothetical protein
LNVLVDLQESAFSNWLALSMLGFPTLIALHSVGMAIVVGLSLIVTLRLYGLLEGVDGGLLPRLLTVAIGGFTLNFLTGILLFITRGSEYIVSLIFLTKMLLVIVSAALLFVLRQHLKFAGAASSAVTADRFSKIMSLVATATWFGAVVAGRLIAYLSSIYR